MWKRHKKTGVSRAGFVGLVGFLPLSFFPSESDAVE
jgi:hypothetical protein